MTKAYETTDADRLIPLLRSVQREIRERSDAIRGLEVRLRKIRKDDRTAAEFSILQAELADNRREIRLAKKELERLGCVMDESDPHRILIPGASGALTDGFSWSYGDSKVEPTAAGQVP